MIASRSHLPSVARTAIVIDVVPYIKSQAVCPIASTRTAEPIADDVVTEADRETAHQIAPEPMENAIDDRVVPDLEDETVDAVASSVASEPQTIDVVPIKEDKSVQQVVTEVRNRNESPTIDVKSVVEKIQSAWDDEPEVIIPKTLDVVPMVEETKSVWDDEVPTVKREPKTIDVKPVWENNHKPTVKSEPKTIDVKPIAENNQSVQQVTPTVKSEPKTIDVKPIADNNQSVHQKNMFDRTESSKVIDVTPHTENESGDQTPPPQERGGGLATTQGSFKEFLAPLNKDSFKEVVTGVEDKLKVVNQTLTMLTHSEGFETILQDMLNAITLKTAELLNADRTTIYLLDEEKNELWSIVAKNAEGQTLEIRFPATQGIAGEVATFRKCINIPYDFYDDPRSAFAKIADKNNNYRTYTMLVLPLLNEQDELVAVVQLINKLKHSQNSHQDLPLSERIALGGFSTEDERVFKEFAPSIRLILESSRAFYMATQKQRAADALMKANQALSQSSLDLEDTLKRVMDEAKALMNADRSTLWLIDHERDQLWTKIPIGGELREIRIPRTAGFAGIVAETKEPLMIPFDLYKDPRAEVSKQTDCKTGYRTCSMLCMPVFNADGELIGVTQLINKKKQGEYPAYEPSKWPEAPECWKSSFNRSDQEFMQIFNIQAGVALQNAKLFAEVKRQQQMQRDILRSLSNGVISTDKAGNVIAANESAKKLLGISQEEKLEGKPVADLLKIKGKDKQDDDKFIQWFDQALTATDEKKRQQFYPDQVLEALNEEQHNVNLSINSIADAIDSTRVDGVLVVMEDISQEKRLKSTMYRYMTQEVAEKLLESGDTKLGGNRKEVTVLFSDIRSYTTLTESMQAEEVVQMLNEYFESMVDAVFKYKGTLDKYIGDAIMAVFGAFVPLEDHAWMGVQTAIEMRQRLAEFNEKRRENNQQQIKIGIGINSDEVISGNIGSSQRMELTSIGDGVNLGSRLEGASKQYGCDIVISENTFKLCGEKRIWHRELDFIRVKGKTQPVSIFELVGRCDEPIADEKLKMIEIYHKGRNLYLQKEFRKAMNEFAFILEDMAIPDKAAGMYLKRCQYWLDKPEDLKTKWDDGVWTLTEK